MHDEAGIETSVCARKFSLRLHLYVMNFLAILTNYIGITAHILSSVYTDYSFSSKNIKIHITYIYLLVIFVGQMLFLSILLDKKITLKILLLVH